MKCFFMLIVAAACGGTQHAQVQEVPIDQGSARPSSELPPDEVGGDAAVTTSSTVFPDGSAPVGVGPQSLDGAQQDAGAQTAQVGFVQRTGGLTQKECTDVVMTFAKLDSKQKHVATPTQADLAQHPTFGPMINDCGSGATKKQQKCGMTARSTAAWQKCME
jgi:hypothetical protein